MLHIRLSRTAKALKKWNRSIVWHARFITAMANEVIFNLDVAQESRLLSEDERQLHRFLKNKLLGIAAVDRIKWRQRSRISWVKEGDANTKLFHIRATGRRRKNFISRLSGAAGLVTKHEDKAQILLSHFNQLMGTHIPAVTDLG